MNQAFLNKLQNLGVMSLIVKETGLFSLLVDYGRAKTRSFGMPVGGAADRTALALGNGLVGNRPDALALEVTLLGPTLEACHPTACVLFGAAFQCAINASPLSVGTTFTLKPGDVLRIGGARSNARAYLCVAGGFEAERLLGSCSGIEPVRVRELLTCRPSLIKPRALPFETSDGEHNAGTGPKMLRVVPGPQHDWFPDHSFDSHEFEVSPASNRMGMRLRGEPLTKKPGELVSEAVAPGAIQVTNDGQLIVLGMDGQTIGGYAKIAHVIRADLDRLGQLRPGERVRFVYVSQDDARKEAKARTAFLHTWLTRLRASVREPQFLDISAKDKNLGKK